jgi:hypothetical protein
MFVPIFVVFGGGLVGYVIAKVSKIIPSFFNLLNISYFFNLMILGYCTRIPTIGKVKVGRHKQVLVSI